MDISVVTSNHYIFIVLFKIYNVSIFSNIVMLEKTQNNYNTYYTFSASGQFFKYSWLSGSDV